MAVIFIYVKEDISRSACGNYHIWYKMVDQNFMPAFPSNGQVAEEREPWSS